MSHTVSQARGIAQDRYGVDSIPAGSPQALAYALGYITGEAGESYASEIDSFHATMTDWFVTGWEDGQEDARAAREADDLATAAFWDDIRAARAGEVSTLD